MPFTATNAQDALDELDAELIAHAEDTGLHGGGSGGGAYAETIGDGMATSIQVTHDLGTEDVIVQVWDVSGADPVLLAHDHADFPTSITVDDVDNVTLVFGSAPATDEYRVVVIASGTSSSELDYTQITSGVSPTTSVTTVITAGAVSMDGSTAILIEFYAANARGGLGTNENMTLMLYEDGSSIGTIGLVQSGSGPANKPLYLIHRRTPASGSRTYSIRAQMQASTGLIAAGAGGAGNTMPAFIRITRA